ncbi:sugar ABC transporter permease [Paenibacillus sp. J5C_2022]|nr:sugar ABC transporter permease [Paenibacillus sp. J5C2022]
MFVLPTVIMIFTFSYYPAIAAFYYSFTNWDGFRPAQFIGFDNFVSIFTTEEFRQAFLNLLWITLFSVFVTITVPLIVALFIYKIRNQKLQYFYRLLFVFPMVVPAMVGILLWQFILNPDVGLMNAVLSASGVPQDQLPLWLASPKTAMLSLFVMGFPYVSGVNILIYLAGLQNIPKELKEAAIVDGANGFRLFFKIELPLVMSQIKLLVILTVIGVLQSFHIQLVLTGGGPMNSTTVPGYIMYKEAINNNQLGYGCAIGVVLFLLIFTLTVINNKYLKSSTEYDQG